MSASRGFRPVGVENIYADTLANSLKRAVRAGGDQMALDVERVVDRGVCGKKFLG
jgi:hypothetical protein